MSSDELTLREYRPGDEGALAAARAGSGSAAVDPEEWSWRHLENPTGRRVWIAETSDGRIAQALSGVPRRVVRDGEACVWTSLDEWIRDPALGRRRDRAHWLTSVAAGFAERWGGAEAGADSLFYALPGRAAYRVANGLLDYEVIRSQSLLHLSADRFRPEPAPGVEVEEGGTGPFPDDMGELFERCRSGFGAAVVRDKPYLDWRFAGRPTQAYRHAVARGAGGRALGLAVVAEARGALRPIAEWLIDPACPAAGDALRTWAGELAFGPPGERGERGEVPRLVAMLPEYGPDWSAFQSAAYRVEAAPCFLVGRSFARRYGERWLFRNWYYTFGDTERV